MLRTQISLTEDQRRCLDEVVGRTGRSLSSLIRAAVDQVYGAGSEQDDYAVMYRTAGSWTGRDVDGAAWVEDLRSGSRQQEHR